MYKEKIGNVLLNYEYYSGKDYYSDGDIEEELLQIVKNHNKKEFTNIIAEKKEWPVLYHLSPVRGNIVEWLPIQKTDTVLEVGAGCGAITDTLAQKASKVTCIELSKRRSEINAYRNQEYNNIEIMVGNFQDIEKNIEEKYDYITLIGVLEYAASYINSEHPYEQFLKIIKKHLKPNGKLIIAIENKFGLKYWAGCKEDHVQKYFKGLEGYVDTKGIQTFSKIELEELADKLGFAGKHFYYPYPDYKLPYTIYSDQYLPSKGELVDNIKNYDQERMQLFDEGKVYDNLLDSQMYPFFSNSYLLILDNEQSASDLKQIYVKYNERAKNMDIRTDIVLVNGEKAVEKIARNEEAKGHLQHIYSSFQLLKNTFDNSCIKINECKWEDERVQFEFINGDTLEKKIDEYLKTGRYQIVLEKIKECYENIRSCSMIIPFEKTEEFVKVFGDVEVQAGIEAFAMVNIDAIPRNFLVDKHLTLNMIDYEWTFNFAIPVKFVLFRNIVYYVLSSAFGNMLNLADALENVEISKDEEKLFWEMENNFQSYVAGENYKVKMSYESILEKSYPIISIAENAENEKERLIREGIQVYFDYGKGFSEENSIYINNKKDGEYCIDIPIGVKQLRIDPAMEEVVIQINYIKAYDPKGLQELEPLGYNGITLDKNLILFDNNDPQIYYCLSDNVQCVKFNMKKSTINSEMLAKLKELVQAHRTEYQTILENKKREIEGYKGEIEGYKGEIEQYRGQIEQYKIIEKAYCDVMDSTSWKITKPLRVLVRGSKEMLYRIAPIRWAWHFFKYAQKDGLAYAWYLVKNKINQNKSEEGLYEQWIANNERNIECKERLEYNPFISVVVPVYNVKEEQLTECIESVLAQTYENWELCLADDASTWECVGKVLKKYENNPRIKVVYRKENGHISRATNSAIEVATGEFIAFMDCDDVLTPNALYEMAKKLNEDRNYDFIYSDEDKIDDDGKKRHMPHFKSDWAPDTFMSYMYTCHLAMYRKSIVDELGGLRVGYEGAQDYDFTLRFMEKANRIGHIPKILYHWRERMESTAASPKSKPYILEAAKRAKEDALKRRGLEGKVELIEGVYQYRVNYLPVGNPKVSIIIPSKDNLEVYERCIVTLFEKTKYKNFEVITIDNGSTDVKRKGYERIANQYGVQYYYEPMNFNFSKMCNIGAEKAEGAYLLFLNDDIEIINEEWLGRMLGQAMLSHVGAVGAKLLYPNSNNIQHTGVINLEQGPVHCFVNMSDEPIYCFARNKLDFNYSAVTGACLLVNKEKFEQVNGFEEELPVAYNDVDLCFKLIEQGYYNVVRNDAVLYHHESVSRGYDNEDAAKMERLTRERNKLYERHPQYYQKDNFYNQNLTQNLPDFSINIKLEEEKCDVRVIDTDKISQFKESSSIAYDINSIVISQNIEIVGFAFLKDKRFNNLRKINVILKGEKESYYVSTYKMYREDLKYNIGHKGKIGMTGFKCVVDKKLVQSGKYELYLEVNGKYCNSERMILC